MKRKTIFSFCLLAIGILLFSCMPIPAQSSPPAKALVFCSSMPAFDCSSEAACTIMEEMYLSGPGDPQRLYAFGNRTAVTLTSSDTIILTPKNTLTVYSLMANSGVVFNAQAAYAIIGDRILLKVMDTTSTRQLKFGTNFEAANDSVTDGYTKIFEFLWTGDKYFLISKAGPYSN